MFSSIIDTWPPEPGPDQTTTGELMYTCELDGHESVNMTGLQAGAWWTGLRLSVPLEPSITAIQFEVSLIVDDGTVLDSWYQDSGATHYLTWPMPALMAKHSGLSLRIRPTQTAWPIHCGYTCLFPRIARYQSVATIYLSAQSTTGTVLEWTTGTMGCTTHIPATVIRTRPCRCTNNGRFAEWWRIAVSRDLVSHCMG